VNGTTTPTTAYGLQVAAASGTAAATTGSTGLGLAVGATVLWLAVGL
jgi:hypothetical protein